jgi:hypothetical protein
LSELRAASGNEESGTAARPARSSPESGSDRELLTKLRSADREAFDALYEAYFFRIYSYFRRRLETQTDAEGATEAALTAIFQDISGGRSQMPLHHWTFSKVRAMKDWSVKSPQPPEAVSVSTVPRSAPPVRS